MQLPNQLVESFKIPNIKQKRVTTLTLEARTITVDNVQAVLEFEDDTVVAVDTPEFSNEFTDEFGEDCIDCFQTDVIKNDFSLYIPAFGKRAYQFFGDIQHELDEIYRGFNVPEFPIYKKY